MSANNLRIVQDTGSFRDPAGKVFRHGDRIFRTVSKPAVAQFELVQAAKVFERYANERRIVTTSVVSRDNWPIVAPGTGRVLEHARIPFISYPYEWSFPGLQAAALHHLDLQIDLLADGFTLSDASAYNVQFVGPKPVFIDVLSIRPYVDGEYWVGHRQFCEQFLNPLLLRSLKGIPHNAWFRGSLEGIPTAHLASMLSLRERLSWNVLIHVVLKNYCDKAASRNPTSAVRRASVGPKMPRNRQLGLLRQIRDWVRSLRPADADQTTWAEYANSNTYSGEEADHKRRIVGQFISTRKPETVIDLGCNSGDYSAAALSAGATRVLGFDADHQAADRAFRRATAQSLNFLPLLLDAANPSPDQGWGQCERLGLANRAKADAVIALAFAHHLQIGRNVPMEQVVRWITDLAPAGVIEFVPKSDPTVQAMLALREEYLSDYTEAAFEGALRDVVHVEAKDRISATGRTLYTFTRPS